MGVGETRRIKTLVCVNFRMYKTHPLRFIKLEIKLVLLFGGL